MATPAVSPLTRPVVNPTAAVVMALLLQLPPAVGSVRLTVDPIHTADAPLIAPGCGLTLMPLVAVQPVPNEYVIVAVPGLTPVTSPVAELMAAIAVLLLLHVPPAVALVKVVVVPAHSPDTPLMAEGTATTVIVFVTVQPVPRE